MRYFSCENATIRHGDIKFQTYSTQGTIKGVAKTEDPVKIEALLADKGVAEIDAERYDLLLSRKAPDKTNVVNVSAVYSPATRSLGVTPTPPIPLTSSGEPTVAETIISAEAVSRVGRARRGKRDAA